MDFIRDNAAIALRILSMTTLMMVPLLLVAALRIQDIAVANHGVGLALLVTLQRGASF